MIQYVVIILTAALLMIYYMYQKAHKNTYTEEVLFFPIEMTERKILFITDIHRRLLDKDWLYSFTNVDFVIIGGDLTEKGVRAEIIEKNVSYLSSLGEVFFVWGNNDYEFGEQRLEDILNRFNVKTLRNEVHVINDTEQWSIVGIDDTEYGRVERTIVRRSIGYSLIISHDPDAIYELELEEPSKVIALLCGHTHGGQIRLGPLGIAEKGGWKRKKNVPVFISSGFGTRKLPLRLGTESQVHVFTLKGKRTADN
ncbi:metallophosphoesterase [Evansella tamaricis]|uniref:Metallophosphoesterase n=1 Tax=Evansella tamaricis TaxID=2069301 RepID=A0ABS6JKS2_9BACI|nr:metallophosphoesterase [Evansella tamaricis]MBU9714267.1 metallophosphoesterase [Evansella tamaricis]